MCWDFDSACHSSFALGMCGFTFDPGGMHMSHMDLDGMIWDLHAVLLTNIKHYCSKAEIKSVLKAMGCDGIPYIQGALT